MDGLLFPRPPFTHFGPNRLLPGRPTPRLHRVRGSRPTRLRVRVRADCPRTPGIYGMIDVRGELIYVGKAKSLRTRLLSYFRPRSRDPKAGRVVAQARTVVWEEAPSEFAALLRELELIRRWQPRCNVQGQPRRRRRVYVCIGRKPAPYLFLATKPTAGVTVWFGPVPGGATAREAVRRVNDAFGLRDCPQAQTMAFADQQELFPVIRAAGCLRHEIGTCLGPCAAACTQAVYRDHVRAARDFLSGVDPSLLDRLNREMHTAANELAFERAAALRDRLRALTWLRTHLDRLRQVRERQSYLYPVHGTDGRVLWYLVHGGKVMTVLPDVDTDESARVVGQVYRRKVRSDGPVPVNDIDGILLVASWFRRHPNERLRLVDPAALAVP